MSTRTVRAWQSTRTRRVAQWFVLACCLVVVPAVGWLGVSAWTVLDAVKHARTEVTLARAAYTDRDLVAGADHVAEVRAGLERAERAASSPVWRVAGTLPVVGDDLRAVAAVTASAYGLVDALEPVTAAAAAGGTGAPVQSVLLQPDLPGRLALAHQRSVEAVELSTEVSGWQLQPAVLAQVRSYGALVAQVEAPLATAASYSALLPRLLGADGPQDLLVAVQTPAEVRSLGGLVGLVLVVRADAGELTVVESYSGSTVAPAGSPVLVTAELAEHYALLGDQVGRYLVNASAVPDAALASKLLAEHHRLRGGTAPDAVVLMDIGMLSGLLTATGPVQLPDGQQLTAATSGDLLQYGVYEQLADPAAQDVFFAGVATTVFDRLKDPATDPVGVARVLADAASTGRLTVWSPEARTQALVAEVGIDGDLLSDPSAVGVFLNDATSAKLQHFLTGSVTTRPRPDGGATVVVELTSAVPDPGTLPDYVAGGYEQLGLPRGAQRVQLAVYGPVGGAPAAWRVDGAGVAAAAGRVDERGAAVLAVDVAPGASVRVEIDLVTEGSSWAGQLVTTPSLRKATD